MRKLTLINPEIEKYAEEHCSWSEDSIAQSVRRDTDASLNYADMLSGDQVTGLLRMLMLAKSAKQVVEVGLFTGYATNAMLSALPPDGQLTALEMNQRYLDLAVKNLQTHPRYNLLQIVPGNARETIKSLPENLDLVFLDADKEYYPQYYQEIIPRLTTGGFLVIDNVFWYGGILSEDKDRKSQAIHTLNETIRNDERVESVMLTIRDGLTVVRKLR
ncbi:MAG: putative O-methyltransferase - COG4122 [Bacteroidetes bacterium HLUCCA01]|nr:MAG: putative O-methyltransferase - COG4122 [Bacteroidetes bacterium HLUCCA01]